MGQFTNTQQPPSGLPDLPGPLADWGTRFLGLLIDAGCVFVAALPFYLLTLVSGSPVGSLLTLIAVLGVQIWFAVQIGSTGQSPGMRVAGVRCISLNTGQVLGDGMGVVRWLAMGLNSVICYIGWLFPLWDAKKQTLGDMIVSTVVYVVPRQSFNLLPPSTV